MLNRGYNGVYHHVYHHGSCKRLAQYINEFTFRLNDGNVRRDTQDRMDDLFCQAIGKRLTCQTLTR